MIGRPARRFQRVGAAAAFAGQGSDAAHWHVVLQSWRPGDGAAKYIADAETFLSPTMIERFDQIDGSALLTRTGDGHTSIYTSDCARSAADTFLVESRSEANRICEG